MNMDMPIMYWINPVPDAEYDQLHAGIAAIEAENP